MKKKRIVITGMGIVSCFGNEVDDYYKSLLDGKSGASLITSFPCEDYPTRIAASIKNFDSGDYIDKKQARRIDKNIAYAMVAGKKALEASQLNPEAIAKLNKERCGVVIGSGMGGMDVYCQGVQTLMQKGQRWVSPFFVPYILTNMGGAMLAMDIGFMGPNYSVSTACATGNNAIIAAANHIRKGEADLMICGGSEAPIIPMGLSGFCSCKALSQRNDEPEKASRPWDRGRDGFLMGEGAGIFIIESLEHALARGAPILAEYLGGGMSCDAYHITEPRADSEGVALCVRNALLDAGIKAEEVNYINAHGTSTPAGDMAEVRALKKVFKEPSSITMNSTKSMIGHCLGAAGAMEAVVTAKAIESGWVHPSINLEDPEPDLEFHIPTAAEKKDINIAISNTFGFGGHNATIVLGAYHP
ncbi:beta-ketoacyl-ACP synthase II [Neochlamydia sp. AcF95]|uniref:beta-ketoacyl-ACP synthase II n=1 Tax=Neochlamydia sp. AcF95 TaxID=2795734 RepID=UPI001BC9EB5C|nr:beta-ketoacyl-ACP synthase II [Neochlamydia sp. AcF95]MBS4169954.1 3-oxoacyl-[acyl-carrier-protein] synthase I, chloroplastic [Neochlamydia sp. AcF95]